MMKNEDIFEEMTPQWALCLNGECPRSGECLRYQLCRQAPAGVTRWLCVLPTALNDGDCAYFRPAEKVRMARGLNSIFKNVRNRQERQAIRLTLTRLLGSKGTYYRYKNGERWIGPKLQQQIEAALRQNGLDGEVTFDYYEETYDLTE